MAATLRTRDKRLPTDVEPLLHTIAHTAAVLGMSQWSVRQLITNGKIRSIKLGPKLERIPATEIRRLATPSDA